MPLSVELFHDRDYSNSPAVLPTEGVFVGLALLEQVIESQLSIIGKDRTYKLSYPPGKTTIIPENITWSKLRADISIILTERDLWVRRDWMKPGLPSTERTYGLAGGVAVLNSNLVIVSFAGQDGDTRASNETAHGISHLWGPVAEGTSDDPWHCPKRDCLMYKTLVTHQGDRPGLTAKTKMLATDFCDDCKEQVAVNYQQALGRTPLKK